MWGSTPQTALPYPAKQAAGEIANSPIMMSQSNQYPQYPAHEGDQISGDPAQGVLTLGTLGGHTTSDPVRSVAQGATGRRATCVPTPTGAPLEEGSKGSKGPLPRKGSTKKPQTAAVDKASDSEELMEGSSLPSDSEGERTLLATPSETPAPVELAPSTSQGAKSISQKRKAEAGPTPPTAGGKKKKKSKQGSKLGASFKEAAKDNLLGVVLVDDNPYQVLTRAQIASLREKLGKRVDAAIDSDDEFIPRFTESGMRNSRFCLSCNDRLSFCWLQTQLETLNITEESDTPIQLRLASPSEVPKLSRAEVFIPGPPPGVPRFLKNIQAQNPAFHTERWVLKHQQSSSKHQLLVFGIDPDSIAALASNNYQAFFRLSRVTFRVAGTSAETGDQ